MRVVDEFQRRHPDIKVRRCCPGRCDAAAIDILRGGKCPDVLMVGN